jgi:hypothetical protein
MSRSTSNVSLVVALTAAVATAVAIGYVGYSRSVYKRRRSRLKKEVESQLSSAVDCAKQEDDDDHTCTWLPRQFDEDIVQEFLARNYAFFGAESMTAVRKATVVVVGCGGVGSWAALMLLRRYLPFSSVNSPPS